MYKSDATNIALSMKDLLEKRVYAWDWFKNLFVGDGGEGSLAQNINRSQRLDYNQMLQAINAAASCAQLPDARQWDMTGAPSNMQYELDLVANLFKKRIEKKRKELQQAGKCK